MARFISLSVALVLAGVVMGPTWAADETAPVNTSEALEALREFDKAYRKRDVGRRTLALETLGAVDHPKVAARLGKLVKRKKDPRVQAALLAALASQSALGEKVMKKVAQWLLEEARIERNRIARVKPQVRVDPRTGEPDTTSEEGRLWLETTKVRGQMLREAMLCVRLYCDEPPKDAEELGVFLHDAHDALVIETLETFAKWRLQAALPDLVELYRMYPTERAWETSHILQRAGNARRAKTIWMVQFGHPNKQRYRPEVVQALRKCLESITGRSFDTPEDLMEWLADPEAKRRSAA